MANIISIILLLILLLFTIKNIKENRFLKTKKYIITLYVLSIVLFIILFVTDKDFFIKNRIFNSLTIALIIMPFTLQNINNLTIDEKISRIKTIITNKINEKQLLKFKQSKINVVLISKEENKLKLKETKVDEISIKTLKKTTYIKSSKMDLLDKYCNQTTIKKTSNLNATYKEIIDNRRREDNYIKTIKFILSVYIPLILSIIVFKVYNITSPITLLLVLMIKYITVIISRYIINNNKDDHDIIYNKPKPYNKYITKQEMVLTVIHSLVSYAFLLTPYLYLLLIGGSKLTINTIYLVILFYIILFDLTTYITERTLIKNLLNKSVLLMALIIIVLTLIINHINIFANETISFRNYLPCVIIALISTLFYEYTKLARYLTMKGKKKNELKNN